ncbi:serine/threonine-protein kinase [Mycolicibacterium holsaticum]|uniref:serine/threonine-protein kinase n=1 Tax=Mycolicibacterium holsaticum TaxID=152142 RepID=UPI00240A4626|nr:serine/threonine-protein kinase [Mycolicibacterium holsaticum]UNC11042.1 serine/threonine protein kinase [Mycolicibacterium holsaticum DSM 44478 = JCM 12374]
MDDTPQHSRVGSRFGPYLIKRLIGRGGMGEVYEAEDTVKGRVVALKLLPDALSGDPVFRERLQREARSAGKLQEPHVVPVHDYGEIDGHLFVDMRLIDGIDLRTTLQRTGPMPPAQAVGLVRQIAAALDAAHDAGVMHRDVKPENILVTRDGFAYLVDFGIASAATDHTLTEKGTAIGTYAYMAPERFSSDPVTYRADIYALACVLHQCLTGSQPYRTDSLSMLITAHLIQPAPRPSQVRPGVPPAFDAVVEKGMAKRAEDRYASAGELARAAEAAVGPPDSSAYPTVAAAAFAPPPPRGRRRPLVIGGAAALVVVVALAGVVTWLVARSPGNASGMSETLTITRTVARGPRAPIETTAALTPTNASCSAWSPIRRHARRTSCGAMRSRRSTARRPRRTMGTARRSTRCSVTPTRWKTSSSPSSPTTCSPPAPAPMTRRPTGTTTTAATTPKGRWRAARSTAPPTSSGRGPPTCFSAAPRAPT